MRIHRLPCLYFLALLMLGLALPACIVTDPTKSSSDITSSTSPNSSSEKAFNSNQKVRAFAHNNFDRLKQDMALGQGEHLASLAALLEVPAQQQAGFFALTKDKFPSLVRSEQVTPDQMLAALHGELATHPDLYTIVAKN